MDVEEYKAKAVEEQIKEDLRIDDTNLQEELRRQPGKYFYWSVVRAKASEKRRMKSMNLKEVDAKLEREVRERMSSGPKIKITERMLDEYLSEHPEHKAANSEVIKAQYAEDLLEACVEAFKERHYALIEIVKSRESEKIMKNEFEVMRKELEEQEKSRR